MKKILFLLCSVLPVYSFATSPAKLSKKVEISIDTSKIVHRVKPEYLSFGLDTAQIVGSYWWDREGKMNLGRGKNKTKPLNLKQKKLIELARALSPAYLRIGGSEADALYYNLKDNSDKRPEGYDSTLTKKKWKEIESFIKQTQTKLFFTVNQGPSSWKDSKWDSSNFEDFLKYISTEGSIPLRFELGNEVFAYWAIFGLKHFISEKDYAKNYLKAKKLIQKYKPDAALAGPASAYWPIIGEPLGFIFNKLEDLFPLLKKDFETVSWHYYPSQSFRCPVAVRRANKERFKDIDTYTEVEDFAEEILELKEKYSPNAELWLGETGSAQCGGEPGVSDQFISSLWWLDQLGVLATYKHDVIIRHNLIGADYALLNDDASPRPDYYSSWLWKMYMGEKVFKTKSSHDTIRAYAHCAKDSAKLSVLLVNISNKTASVTLKDHPEFLGKVVTTTDLYSQNFLVNKKKVLTLSDLKTIPPEELESLTIPAWSYSFIQTKKTINKCKK